MDTRAAEQVDVKQATTMEQVYTVMYAQLESSMTVEQRARALGHVVGSGRAVTWRALRMGAVSSQMSSGRPPPGIGSA
eukprot:15454669-Alexandrium_andersonii.AAC.1